MQISQVRRHTLNRILIKYDNKDVSVNLYNKCLNFYSKILLEVLRNMN